MVAAGAREASARDSGTPDAQRLALLVDASQRLADAGLEPTAVLERLCALMVPRLSQACSVRLLSKDGRWLHSVASAYTSPEARPLMEHLASIPQPSDRGVHSEVLLTGHAIHYSPSQLTELQGQLRALYPRHMPAESPPVSLSIAHLLVLPLRARQRMMGTLAVYRGPEDPPFELTEQLLMQELVDRAGLALDLARAHEAERRARHEAEVAAERLARLQRVTVALSEAITSADVARVVVEEMIAAIGADRAVMATRLEAEPEQLEVVSHRGVSLAALESMPRIPLTAPLPVTMAYRTGEPVWLESREVLAQSFPSSLIAEPDRTRAVVALPLRLRGRALGVIGFGFDSHRTFNPDERGLLLDLARQSAQALERAWLYESAQQARTRAERVAARTARLQTLNSALSQVLTAPRVAEVVFDQGLAAIGAQMACLWLADASGTQVRLLRSVGLTPEMTRVAGHASLGQGNILDDIIRRGEPVWLESREELARRYPGSEARLRETPMSEASLAGACLPLMVDGRSLGGIAFGFRGVHHFDDDERVFLSLLAHHAAQALERARLFEQERLAREALRDAHHTLRAIIESSPMAIILLELDGKVRLWNPAAEHIFGWTAEEALGRRSPIVPEDKLGELQENLARVARGESILGRELRRQRRDGSLLDVAMWSTSVQVAGDQRLCLSILADITERKRAEEALRFLAEASTLLASSLDHEVTLERVAHLAVPTYADGCHVYLLGEGGRVSCVATASAADQREPPRELGPLEPGGSAVSRVILSGRPELCMDRAARRTPPREQSPLPCELATNSYLCVPLLVRGQTLGALSFVSSHHDYDAQDLEMAQELARRAALALDNARLYRDAREAIRVREEFLSIASHELRTPITSLQLQVQGLLGALTRGPDGLPPERLRRGLEVMDRQVKRQMHLVSDLLDVSRLDEGRLVLRPESLDLATLTREVAERFEQELVRTGSRLTLSAPEPVSGQWDRLRLEQVVTNLISNAVKYGQGNPIELTVDVEGGSARLVVRDSGIGIAPEHLDRVFGRFERAVSERHYGGFGLGLWIARQIIEAMGGHISVRSQLGQGSTFCVQLPREVG
ncbi:GAF domain-containing protein [Archangium violaceum]|uniref:GAF domain-containing protein n=1 Tax=Archangium violaceum TaxID=83451 RepID=UPI00194F5407|nr:GAF domain-containing protein [Archangium violaceum]QRN96738.1 GAF domain-containing protein [Archangium violaceum]